MSSSKKASYFPNNGSKFVQRNKVEPQPISLLDSMIDGREYGSIIGLQNIEVQVQDELQRALLDISAIRGRPTVCYMANVLNPDVQTDRGINHTDEKPFLEMIENIPSAEKNIDIVLVTPGGSGEIVSTFVSRIRSRFENVGFILPYMCMSAGTIFCLSGDELIMDANAFIGPIDPQVRTQDGRSLPAQALKTLLADIQERGMKELQAGQQPSWTDIMMLNRIDPRDLGNVISGSQFSTNLVSEYLEKFKFRDWSTHSSNGRIVTDTDKRERAMQIAKDLCDHSTWLSHASRISRELAWDVCKLRTIHPESIEGLARAIRRFWAVACFALERTRMFKAFLSPDYILFRIEQDTNSERGK